MRPRHVCELIEALEQQKKLGTLRKDGTRVETDELIAPRTVCHVYGTVRVMRNDAAADEVISSNPRVSRTSSREEGQGSHLAPNGGVHAR